MYSLNPEILRKVWNIQKDIKDKSSGLQCETLDGDLELY